MPFIRYYSQAPLIFWESRTVLSCKFWRKDLIIKPHDSLFLFSSISFPFSFSSCPRPISPPLRFHSNGPLSCCATQHVAAQVFVHRNKTMGKRDYLSQVAPSTSLTFCCWSRVHTGKEVETHSQGWWQSRTWATQAETGLNWHRTTLWVIQELACPWHRAVPLSHA